MLSWRFHFPELGIEDSGRKPQEDARHTGLLAWDPLRTSRSTAYPRASVFSVLFLPDVKTSAIHTFDHLFLTGNGVGPTEAFPNFNQNWPAFSEPLLGYLSALSLAREWKKCSPYSRSWQTLRFNTGERDPLVFFSPLTKSFHLFLFFPLLSHWQCVGNNG